MTRDSVEMICKAFPGAEVVRDEKRIVQVPFYGHPTSDALVDELHRRYPDADIEAWMGDERVAATIFQGERELRADLFQQGALGPHKLEIWEPTRSPEDDTE